MEAWKNLMRDILANGSKRPDRTGVGTLSVFGRQVEFCNHLRSFPAVTIKKLAYRQAFAEMACFLRGYTTLEEFHSLGCTVWDANGLAASWTGRSTDGDLGRIYGAQWRDWRGIEATRDCPMKGRVERTDQLAELVGTLREDPTSRRMVVTAWNPSELRGMCLPPCHTMFQCYVSGGSVLEMLVSMRSVDVFLGLPFDVAGYALLQRLLARETGLRTGKLKFSLGDTHLYLNHMEQVLTVLERDPKKPPELRLAPEASLFEFHPSMAELIMYDHHDVVSAPINV